MDDYSIDPYSEDELKALEREERRERVAKIRDLKLKERELKLEGDVKSLEKRVATPAIKPAEMKADDAIKIVNLPPEQQEKVMQVLQTQAAINAMASNPNAALMMPLMLGMYAGKNPSASQTDLLKVATELGKSFQEGLKTGITVSGAKEGMTFKDGMQFGKDFFSELRKAEGASGTTNAFLQFLLKQLETQPDPLEYLTKMTNAAEAMGYVKGGSTAEVEKMKLEYQDRWKTEAFRHTAELKKLDGLLAIGEKIVENLNLSEGVARGIAGGLMGLKGQPPKQSQPSTPPPRSTAPMAKCSVCGQTFAVTQDMEDIVDCPNPSCDTKLDIGALRHGGASQQD